MPINPFSIEALTFPNELLAKEAPFNISGYFLKSTAPENVEGSKDAQFQSEQKLEATIRQIAKDIYAISKSSTPEIAIAIHGYNTKFEGEEGVKRWYQSIFQYVNQTDDQIKDKNNLIFIGYRWPSEKAFTEKFRKALEAMPVLPRSLLIGGVILGLFAVALNFVVPNSYFNVFTDLFLALFVSLSSMMFALVFLRRLVYFRDQYRATNFAVPDLVEFIQRLEREILKVTQENESKIGSTSAIDYWKAENRSVELNFLGHSMGGFVVTNTVRVLSDVFSTDVANKYPSAAIGNVFCLSRLVLASPDIPVMTILSGRANFLASSLRRFREAYLFSNEGDIALRLASTTANYFTFPSGTRESGYRLGNVAIKSDRQYGVINLTKLNEDAQNGGLSAPNPTTALKQLFVTNLGAGNKYDTSLGSLSKDRYGRNVDKLSIADLFTFFDCTDYKDETNKSNKVKGVLSAAKGTPLNIWDYIPLLFGYVGGSVDVHGGYFQGKFSQQVIYSLLFLGFGGLLDSLHSDSPHQDREQALQSLHRVCQGSQYCSENDLSSVQGEPEGIKVLLSPLRYYVDVKGEDYRITRETLLDKIRD